MDESDLPNVSICSFHMVVCEVLLILPCLLGIDEDFCADDVASHFEEQTHHF